VPFEALSYVFGRDPMFWYRAWLAFGRVELVGTTVKDVTHIPEHLVADEKFTWLNGKEHDYNFHPYGSHLRRDQLTRLSPFADLNGFQYHPNWLHNFLLASSMGGLPTHHKFR
jgi:hypothetical protein